MRYHAAVDRNVWLLSYAFGVLFFVTGAAQQYVTPWFQQRGQIEIGYNVLLLIYTFYAVGSFGSAAFVNHLGEKASFVIASSIYLLFCLAIGFQSISLNYTVAIAGGLAAAVLWTGQIMYLNRVADDSSRAASAGVFWSIYSLGNGVGAIIFGIVVSYMSYPTALVVYAVLGLGAILIFRCLAVPKPLVGNCPSTCFVLPAAGWTCVMCAAIAFGQRGIYGLVVSRVPLEVEAVMGRAYVGLMSAPFFILPFFLSRRVEAMIRVHGHRKVVGLGFLFSMSSLGALFCSHDAVTLAAAIVAATLGATILNPIITVLPGEISDSAGLARVSGLFSVASSSGILVGIAAAKAAAGKSAYLAVGAIVIACCVVSSLVLRTSPRELRSRVKLELAGEGVRAEDMH